MKRLGKFTGKIYSDEDFSNHKIHECATLISDEEASDEKFIEEHHLRDLLDCMKCFNCPAAQGGIIKN